MKLHYCESLNDLTCKAAIEALASRNEIDLAESKDFWEEEGQDEWEACEESFSRYFDSKVAEYSKDLGKPFFRGGMEDEGFPEDYLEQFGVPADYLVLWKSGGTVYGLSMVQEDSELPFVISFKKLAA